jgi:hypothetical protein
MIYLPPMPAMTVEFRVQCGHLAIGVQFGKWHQARIGQGHGGVIVAARQGFQRRRLGLEVQRDGDDAGLNLLLHRAVRPCAGK